MTHPRPSPSVLHVDMDAFFAAVEVRRDPSLRGKPVVVGGTGGRGVVASCTYEARAYGVRSAMPSAHARRLCPHAVFIHGNYSDYTAASAEIHQVFARYTPLVEAIGLDEAFLDVAGAERLLGDPRRIAEDLRAAVREATGLACSVGAATTKMLAKLASEAAKPRATTNGVDPGRGVVVVEPGDELAFLHPLPVRALWGVGPATHRRLERLGVVTVGDLARVPLESLVAALGRSAGHHLHELAWGRDPRAVVAHQEARSIGHEETYARDLFDAAELRREVRRLGEAVASRLRASHLAARTLTLKVRFADFTTITRSRTSPAPLDTAHDLTSVAFALLDAVELDRGVRLLGLSASNLRPPAGEQLTIDEARPAAWEQATAAVDALRARFGEGSVGPGSLLDGGALRPKRRGDQQWGPER